ncbi:restriction endonuclease subunit S [Anaerobutyricum hallii]|uniref:restriction endonuclease subunit S n=1 Tax=Anaerobutyricum hallii TaxID=39488 RepID=UPI002676C50B|nr:restriction endonuclease subunit S [Anaerobutyricum hallii]
MAMKESGIEWVGLIPDGWKIAKNNRLFNISKQLVNENWKNTQLLSLTKSGIIEKNINDGGGKQPESFGTYQYVEKDDIVLCLFDIDVSAVFSDRSKYDGMISPAYRVMKCTDAILPVYAKWWFDAVNIGRYYLIYTKSLRKTIDADGFGNILSVVPPLSEQQAIADYLDKTCSKIDEIIAEAKASIDEYKELKQSVIFEAVTKGLDKNVEMKQCSVNWLDEIPSTWESIRLKYLLTEINNRSKTGTEQPLSVSQVMGVVPSYMIAVANPTASYVGQKIVEPNDIVFNKLKAHLGVFFMSKYHGLVSPDYAVYRTNDKVIPKYLEYLFHTSACISEFKKYISGVAEGLMRLYTSNLFNIRICLPKVDEQIKIVEYVENKVELFNSLISEKESLINDLEAYKKSLIYEVVTGKRRVV